VSRRATLSPPHPLAPSPLSLLSIPSSLLSLPADLPALNMFQAVHLLPLPLLLLLLLFTTTTSFFFSLAATTSSRCSCPTPSEATQRPSCSSMSPRRTPTWMRRRTRCNTPHACGQSRYAFAGHENSATGKLHLLPHSLTHTQSLLAHLPHPSLSSSLFLRAEQRPEE
jgi:hypothetical protein